MSKIATIAKCLNLAFKQKLLKEDNLHVISVVTETIEGLGSDGGATSVDQSMEAMVSDLKGYVMEILGSEDTVEYPLDAVKTDIKLLTLGNSDVRGTIYDLLEQGMDNKREIKKAISKDLHSVEKARAKVSLEKLLYTAYKELRSGKSAVTVPDTIEDLKGTLGKITVGSTKSKSVLDNVDMDNEEEVAALVTSSQERYNNVGSMKLKWDKLNTFIGGSFRLGDFVLIPASNHNYKTGIANTIFTQLCRYNKAPDCGDKKPLLLKITAEDPLTNNVEFMHKQITYTETGEPVDFTKEEILKVTKSLKAKLTETGFSVRMVHVNPTLMTTTDLFDLIIKYESEGYEVKAIVFDYLSKISKRGIPNDGIAGNQLKAMYDMVRNFMAARKILFISPIQLSTEVDSLRSILPPAKVLPTAIVGNKFDSGKAVGQIPDTIFGVNIIRHNDETYLHVYRGKLRSSIIVPHAHKSFFMKMPDNGMPIPDTEEGVYNLPASGGSVTEEEESLF